MGILTKLLGAGVSDIVSSIGDAIDKNVTSDEERLTLQNELTKISLEYQDKHEEREKELDLAADQEVTARLQSDNTSDNKWSKNIRPVSFAFSLGMLTLFTVMDGNWGKLVIKDVYITVWEYIVLLQIGFYFSSRGLEKISTIVSKVFKK